MSIFFAMDLHFLRREKKTIILFAYSRFPPRRRSSPSPSLSLYSSSSPSSSSSLCCSDPHPSPSPPLRYVTRPRGNSAVSVHTAKGASSSVHRSPWKPSLLIVRLNDIGEDFFYLYKCMYALFIFARTGPRMYLICEAAPVSVYRAPLFFTTAPCPLRVCGLTL